MSGGKTPKTEWRGLYSELCGTLAKADTGTRVQAMLEMRATALVNLRRLGEELLRKAESADDDTES